MKAGAGKGASSGPHLHNGGSDSRHHHHADIARQSTHETATLL
jgi:hypothetical protein